jgi:hypothetical protein
MVTNQQLFDEGNWIDQWACDVDFETGETKSNGSTEVLVEWEGLPYLIIIAHDNSAVRHPDKTALPQMQFKLQGE